MNFAQPDAGIKSLTLPTHAPPMLAGFPRFGARAMYLVQTIPRPAWATIGASLAMLLLSHVLAAVDPSNQGPAWLASIAGTTGIGGGLVALAFHAYREWRQQTRDDRREREFAERIDRNYRDHRAAITADLAAHARRMERELEAHQKRLDTINEQIATQGKRLDVINTAVARATEEATEKRHKLANAVQRDSAELRNELLDVKGQVAEIPALKTELESLKADREHPRP